MTDKDYKEMIHSTIVPMGLPYVEQEIRYRPLAKFLQTETPERLYRFRCCKERHISEFEQDLLGFAPGIEMNDDFDALLFFKEDNIKSSINHFFENLPDALSAFTAGNIPDAFQCTFSVDAIEQFRCAFAQVDEMNKNILIQNAHEFFFQEIENNSQQINYIAQNMLKFACFSETVDSSAMWGYYADSGKGFALAYDFRNSNYSNCSICQKRLYCSSAETCNLYRVIYDDEPFDATGYATWLIQQKILQDILGDTYSSCASLFFEMIPCPDSFMAAKILLHKSTSWKHEQEWRLIYGNHSFEHLQRKFPYVKKRPSAVYLGRNISSEYEKVLSDIAAKKGIPVYKMRMEASPSSYKLQPQLICAVKDL